MKNIKVNYLEEILSQKSKFQNQEEYAAFLKQKMGCVFG
jgi:hypothetical protein